MKKIWIFHWGFKKFYALAILTAALLFVSLSAFGTTGNIVNDSFAQSKKWLEGYVYYDHRVTLYCEAPFNAEKTILLPEGFIASKFASRANRVEWEHVVPAENFGRTFEEWRDGNPICRDIKGKPFKGRKCAEKASQLYRYMQSDMYNLYPAIGAVNAARLNYNFTQFQEDIPSSFGSCLMKIYDRKVEPPQQARGVIGRTYLYFEDTYPRYRMSKAQRQLMEAWNKQYPVTEWECIRSYRIEKIQKNENNRVKKPCQDLGLWPQEE